MKSDRVVLLVAVALFVAANAYLLGTGRMGVGWEAAGTIVAAGLTLALYSFLYQDNPLFRFAEHLFVGVAAAYVFALSWYPVLRGELMVRLGLVGGGNGPGGSNWWMLAPTALGLLLLTRLSSRGAWMSRIPFAFVVGLGAGFTIPRYVSSYVLAQLEPTLQPVTWDAHGLEVLLILAGVLSVLVYFFFSIEHRGPVKAISRVGVYFLMLSFGASFGYTIMARLSLLIGRATFLMRDWLHLL